MSKRMPVQETRSNASTQAEDKNLSVSARARMLWESESETLQKMAKKPEFAEVIEQFKQLAGVE